MPLTAEERAAINRNNAKNSTGPKGEKGKKTSSQNARRHGITAQTTIMTDEDRIEHDKFCANLMDDLAPVGAMEIFYASSVAEEAWRLNYARAQANNVVALGHFEDTTNETYDDADHPEVQTAVTTARSTRDQSKTLDRFSLYESRIRRALEKFTEKLEKLQAARKAKHEEDLEEARMFFQMAEIKGIPWNPTDDGFVFSDDEVARYTDRYHRRQDAAEANFRYRKDRSAPKDLPIAA